MMENTLSQSMDQARAAFSAKNPDFSLIGANLYQKELLDALNWEGLDRENTLENLRAYQRLSRLCEEETVIKALIDNGLDSAHKIGAMTEAKFVTGYASLLNISEEATRNIHKNAQDVKAKTMLLWANVKDVVASPHYNSMKVNNVGTGITEFFEALPSYQEIFGSLDYYEVEEAKSIFGPAAYFVDLMRIVEENIGDGKIPSDHTLEARRPDLKKILLTEENTYKTVPYLQIVNEVLVNAVKNYPEKSKGEEKSKEEDSEEVFQSLVTAKYPFNLPFNLPLEQMRTYLEKMNVKLSEIFETFEVDKVQSIDFYRECLNLSREEYDLVTTSQGDAVSLGENFGFATNLFTTGQSVEIFLEKTELNHKEVFMAKTGLDEAGVTELFNLDLSEKERKEGFKNLPCSFINRVQNSTGNMNIVLDKDSNGVEYEKISNLDFNKLDRINRSLRLAQKLGWTYVELDCVLTSIGATEINKITIENIAKIKQMAENCKMPLITLCSLWSDIRTVGEGDETSSKAVFDVIFNDPTLAAKREGGAIYHPKASGNSDKEDDSSYKNLLYKDEILVWAVAANGFEEDKNKKLARSIVSGGIPASGNDLKAISEFLFGAVEGIRISIPNLSTLYRHAKIPKLLGMKIPEYLVLLTLLGKKFQKDLEINEVLKIFETAQWMKKSKFTAFELDYILNGTQSPYVSKQFTKDRVNQFLKSLQLLMKSSYINEKSFTSTENAIDENLSLELFKVLIKHGLVSEEGVVLLEGSNSLNFKHWNKAQYEQILKSVSTEQQVDYVIHKLYLQKKEQEEQLGSQLAVFFGAKAESMSAIVKIGQALMKGYISNWVQTFAENIGIEKSEGELQDCIEKIMTFSCKYLLLAQKLKLKGEELTSIGTNHFAYNISNFEKLTLNNIKGLYDYKQLVDTFGSSLSSYFQSVSDGASADDVDSYINKQINKESVDMLTASLQELIKSQYLKENSFVSTEGGIDEGLSKEFFYALQKQGFINVSGGVLLEEMNLKKCKEQYEVQYGNLLDIALKDKETKENQEKQVDSVLNKVFQQRKVQESLISEELAVFFNVSIELMEVLVKIASKVLIEYMQDSVQIFGNNGEMKENIDSSVIQKFITVTSLYLVLARKLKLDPAELYILFLDNGVMDIETLRTVVFDNVETKEDFEKLVNTLEHKESTKGSFALIKKGYRIDRMLQALYDITGWDKPQIKELCNTFFEADTCSTVAELCKLKKCFDMAERMGVDVHFLKEIYASKELPALTGSFKIYKDYACKILEALKGKYSEKAWTEVYGVLSNSLEEKKRNKLVSAAIWKIGQIYSDIKNSNSLYKYLLIDVEMSGEAQISYIKHGLNSLQLYLHRCRMNLEKGVTVTAEMIPEPWWEWIMSYRAWEANRKVFLYPENYLDPSLRTSKTTLFKGLEESLMQADITSESAEEAFKKYLDEFSQLAKLRYVDSYYCTVEYPHRGPKDTLFLFAQTQTAPYDYYFCTKETEGIDDKENGDLTGVWTEWKKIDLTINAEYITPVFAFNRLFIFWVETKETTDMNIDEKNTSNKIISKKATIKYSFYNFSGDWISPQTLIEDKVIDVDPSSYGENIKTTGGTPTAPFEKMFDGNDIFWKKVYAMNVLPSNYEVTPKDLLKEPSKRNLPSEKIMIMYGPLLKIVADGNRLKLENVTEPEHLKGEDQNKYEENIYSQALNYNRLKDFSVDGYLPLQEAMVLNASLQKDFLLRSSEFLAIAMNKVKNRNNGTCKLKIDALKNQLIMMESDSVIHDNYMGEYKEKTLSKETGTPLFSNIVSPNAKIITVKNQPGMFIYDNGDETFLLTATKGKNNEDNKENPFKHIQNSYTLKLATPIFREDSFVSSMIEKGTSEKIYKSLVKGGIVLKDGIVDNKFLYDDTQLLVEMCFKSRSIINDKQIKEVKRILDTIEPNTEIDAESFVSSKRIDMNLSEQIFQVLKTAYILGEEGLIIEKYINGKAGVILSQNGILNLTENQLGHIEKILSEATPTTVITKNDFELSEEKIIDKTTSKKIYDQFITLGVVNVEGNLSNEFYKDKKCLILSICMIEDKFILSSTNIDIIKETLKPEIVINKDSFITEIDKVTSKEIFKCLGTDNGILDKQGKVKGSFTEEKLEACLKTLTQKLNIRQIRVVKSICLKNMSRVVQDSFISKEMNIDSATSKQIFKELTENTILNESGEISANLNRNIDLSIVLKDYAVDKRKYVKKILLDLFVPMIFEYDSEAEGVQFKDICFDITRISTGAVNRLSGNLFSGGIDKLLSLESQDELEVETLLFTRLGSNKDAINTTPDFLQEGAQVDFNGPYGTYYWELFFHAPMMIAMKLNANQKFEEAQKWFKYIFDPTKEIYGTKEKKDIEDKINIEEIKVKSSGYHHWNFKPFRDYTLESLVEMLQNKAEIKVYNDKPFDPHAIARLRLGAYEKAAVMYCIDNLIDWGDYLFAQYTWESITEATMLYMYAYDLLGRKPRDLGARKTQTAANFEQHKKYLEKIPQFLIEFENLFSLGSSSRSGVAGVKKPFNDIQGYFSVPGNQQFMGYWDTVEDRMFKIRHSLNIKGEKQLLALLEPQLDPMQIMRASASNNSVFGAMNHVQSSVPHYRFSYMLGKAKEITGTVTQLGASLLSALEKNDGEALSMLTSTHGLNILNMTTMQREKAIEEKLRNLEGLNENLGNAKHRYNTYKKYNEAGLNGDEIASQVLMGKSLDAMISSISLKAVSVAGYLAPSVFGFACGGMKFGDALATAGVIADSSAGILNYKGSLRATNGSYARRKDDWTREMKSAEYDRKQIEKSIEATKIQISMAKKELATHLKTIEQEKDKENFLKSKFTSKDLYNWMVARVSTLYFQTYKLALEVSLQAQRAYQYERASNDSFINYGYWDSLKKGLLAGESLMYSLQQMDKAYMENNSRELEIEKTVSLLQLDPIAFLKFKCTGECDFKLDEELYDFDFPGQYRRKINTLSISIPAVVGPYQNINAMLTQTNNSVILEPDAEAVEYLLRRGQSDTVVKPGVDVLRENWTLNGKVAISKGIEDAGLFTLDFKDERYLPFEGTGAVSSWKLSMPRENNRINFDTISDVLVKIKYTAKDGGKKFATEVNDKLSTVEKNYIVYKHFDLKQQFPNAWHAFMNQNKKDDKQSFVFTMPENILLPNLENNLLQSVYCKLSTKEELSISDKSAKDSFLKLTVKDRIKGVSIPILKNIGMAEEGEIKDVKDFTGEWTLEFDLEKAPVGILLEGRLNPDSLKDIELILNYESNPSNR